MSCLDIWIVLTIKFSKYFKIRRSGLNSTERKISFFQEPWLLSKERKGMAKESFLFLFLFSLFLQWAFITFREEEPKIWTVFSLIFILFHNHLILLKRRVFVLFCFLVFFFYRERESICTRAVVGGEGQREREREIPKQAPHSV